MNKTLVDLLERSKALIDKLRMSESKMGEKIDGSEFQEIRASEITEDEIPIIQDDAN